MVLHVFVACVCYMMCFVYAWCCCFTCLVLHVVLEGGFTWCDYNVMLLSMVFVYMVLCAYMVFIFCVYMVLCTNWFLKWCFVYMAFLHGVIKS